MKVTVWNENLHEKMEERVTELYPGGLHAYIAGFLVDEGIQVRTATLDDEECGLPEEVLAGTEADLAPSVAFHGLLPLGQHSNRRPSASKTLKNIREAPSYSR